MKHDMAPLPPPSLERRQERIELARIIRSYAHLIIVRWSEKKEIGSAVLMRAGNHLFAITAEHCVNDQMRLTFPLREGNMPRAQILKSLKREPFDIAILELEDHPDVRACDIEQVCVDLPKPAGKDADPAAVPIFWVVGYPSCVAQATETTLAARKEVFGTNIVEANQDNFALYYHEDAYGIWPDHTYEVSPLPETPHGFSGGGVWGFSKPEEGQIFDPLKHVRLYGIQYEWRDLTRRLMCVPARVIVEMLLDNYPDLKAGWEGS